MAESAGIWLELFALKSKIFSQDEVPMASAAVAKIAANFFMIRALLEVNVYTYVDRLLLRRRQVSNVWRHVTVGSILEIASNLWIQTDKLCQCNQVGSCQVYTHSLNVLEFVLRNSIRQFHVAQTCISTVMQPKVGIDPLGVGSIGAVIATQLRIRRYISWLLPTIKYVGTHVPIGHYTHLTFRRTIVDISTNGEYPQEAELKVFVVECVRQTSNCVGHYITHRYTILQVPSIGLFTVFSKVNWQAILSVYMAESYEVVRTNWHTDNHTGIVRSSANSIWRVLANRRDLIVVACNIEIRGPSEVVRYDVA